MNKTNNRGFSLLELIIVITIMAIITGISVPKYMAYIGKTRLHSDKEILNTIYNACTIAYFDSDVDITSITTDANGGVVDVTDQISSATLGSTTTPQPWGDAVLDILGMSWEDISDKFRSSEIRENKENIRVEIDADGNFKVTVVGVTDPEDPNGGDYTVPQQY